MIEQIGNAVKFLAFFTASKVGKTGLTVTCDVWSPAGSQIVTGGSASAVGGGAYSYTLASGSVTTEGEYLAIFKTTDTTVDLQHVPALWVVGRGGIEDLDAAISSRNATTPPTAVDIRSELDANSTKLVNLDAAVSSRSTYAGGDTSGVTALLSRLTSTRAGLLDNIDAAISSRLAAAGYTAPDNSGISTIAGRLTSARATLLDNLAQLDAAVSSRLAGGSYTAPDNATITTIATRLSDARATLLDNLSRLDVAVGTRLASAGYTAPDNTTITAIATYVDTEVAAIKTIVDRLNGLLELAGAVYRFKASALEEAPTGSGGVGGTIEWPEGATIREIRINPPGVHLAESLIITRANDYLRADGRQLVATQAKDELWPDLTDAAIAVQVAPNGAAPTNIVGAVTQAVGAEKSIDFEVTHLQFPTKASGTFSIIATLADASVVTLRAGQLSIR
jgi:hypothetical protein